MAKCLPQIDAQKDRLPQATCPATHLCAPCYDPISGASTGACDQNGDTPTEPPVTFPKCCGTIGACVPTSLIPDAQEPMLGKDTCTASSVLCVPAELSDTTFIPKTCNSLGNAEGRCLPSCIPSVAARASSLPRDTCPQTHLCAPCYDPTTGDDTEACRVNGDTPKNPPYTFPKCCDFQGTKRGTCVPKVAAPPAAQNLPQDTCADTTWACIDDRKVADQSFKFTTCLGGGIFQGACVPDCMIAASDRALLGQGSCQPGELCAFCVHPITQMRTGACD
jgi:hypothetical protein